MTIPKTSSISIFVIATNAYVEYALNLIRSSTRWADAETQLQFLLLTDSDIDVQAHANYNTNQPYRCYFTADQLNQSIDTDLNLQVESVQITDNIKDKIVIIDRTVNNILYNTGWFRTDEYHWLDFSKPLSYNINICLNAKKIISTFTGLPIILDLFNAKFDLIWFDDINGPQAYKEHYFSNRNSKLFYYKDYYEQVDIHNTI
jgi:hypothetical protein